MELKYWDTRTRNEELRAAAEREIAVAEETLKDAVHEVISSAEEADVRSSEFNNVQIDNTVEIAKPLGAEIVNLTEVRRERD